MKNLKAYIAGLMMCIMALLPPMYFQVKAPGEYWPWFVFISGFLGFYLFFIKVSYWIKTVGILGFISCFFSSAPVISFNAYFSLIAGCYFFLLCYRIDDYKPLFKMLQTVLFINIFIMLMQFMGKDVLLNFNVPVGCYGSVGQHMQTASFSVILTSALISFHPINIFFPLLASMFCKSVGGLICFVIGLMVLIKSKVPKTSFIIMLILAFIISSGWLVYSGKFIENTSLGGARLGIWVELIRQSLINPIEGFGIGTFQHIFPALCKMSNVYEIRHSMSWKTAHNCWLQIYYETGIIGLIFSISYFIYLFKKLSDLIRRKIFKNQAIFCLAGLLMIVTNMMFHFPTRMIQCVLILIFFFAYCERIIDNGHRQSRNC